MNREKINPVIYNTELNPKEVEYIKLCNTIINDGELRCVRGHHTYSYFAGMIRNFNIASTGENSFVFPMATYRKVFARSIIEEVLMILNGEINTKVLEDQKIKIWSGNTSEEFINKRGLQDDVIPGYMGPMYGYQLRHFNAPYSKDPDIMTKHRENKAGVDQVQKIIDKIKKNHLTRTLIMTTFNPAQVDLGVLYPCTGVVIQYFIDENMKLNSLMYQRSADMLIGVPHNIAMYAFITQIIASICGLETKNLSIMFGEMQVYLDHVPKYIDHIKDGITVHEPCEIVFPKKLNSLDDLKGLKHTDFTINNYISDAKRINFFMSV